jgi:hypothetical protein
VNGFAPFISSQIDLDNSLASSKFIQPISQLRATGADATIVVPMPAWRIWLF